MTTDPTDTTFTINLEEDPEIAYFTWKVEAEDVASNAATVVEPTGLLTLIMKDNEWATYPPNRTTSPGGTITIAPRPVIPAHTPITAGMLNATISVAKYNNDRFDLWHAAKESFKAQLVRSLGPTLAGTIGPPPHGFKTITVMDIMAAVEDQYGTIDQVALQRMQESLEVRLENVRDLNKHLASLTKHILMHEAAGFPLEDYLRVKHFRQSVGHHPQIAACIASYDDKNIDHRTHSYAAITKYVVTHLAPILSTASQMTSQTKAFVAVSATPVTLQEMSTAYQAVMTELEKLKHKTNNKRNQKGQGKGKDKKLKLEGSKKTSDKTDKCEFYCFVHGGQNSHTSQQCKVMANQPTNFTADQRKATGPNSPPGGSTAVRGREPGDGRGVVIGSTWQKSRPPPLFDPQHS